MGTESSKTSDIMSTQSVLFLILILFGCLRLSYSPLRQAEADQFPEDAGTSGPVTRRHIPEDSNQCPANTRPTTLHVCKNRG